MRDEVLARFITYMNRVILHARIDYLRKKKRINEKETMPEKMPEELYYNESIWEPAELSEVTAHPLVNAAFTRLTENEQMVLFHLICCHREVSEVAAIMKMASGSIYRIKRRALQKLREELCEGDKYV